MKYLSKNANSSILRDNLTYTQSSIRPVLRQRLLDEQYGFCAYSEIYIRMIDSHDIEHFDPGKKGGINDSYYNWYVTLKWVNERKAKKLTQKYLPILIPSDKDIRNKIQYMDGIFVATPEGGLEAKNLILFLGLNRPEIYIERKNHIDRLRDLRGMTNDIEFRGRLSNDPSLLSFATALEAELGLNVTDFLML